MTNMRVRTVSLTPACSRTYHIAYERTEDDSRQLEIIAALLCQLKFTRMQLKHGSLCPAVDLVKTIGF